MMSIIPKKLAYSFPAEWHPHKATWLNFPHKASSWPGKIEKIYPKYSEFVKTIAKGEMVCVNVTDTTMREFARSCFLEQGVDMQKVHFFLHPTNDAWCRDCGPTFLINSKAAEKKIIVDWKYNAWGTKYPPFTLDDNIPTLIGKHYNIPVCYPDIVMEGGSIEVNGMGALLTTSTCLLNPNRNGSMSQKAIEKYLCNYYCVEQILWLHEGIIGDDTDGHIDNLARFINKNTVVSVVEENKKDENYISLQKNLVALKKMRLLSGEQLNVVELPMPSPVYYKGHRLPASYANFYICNAAVIVPTYQNKNDQRAIDILAQFFTDRPVVGIDSTDIVWGLGSWHCLSQQDPMV